MTRWQLQARLRFVTRALRTKCEKGLASWRTALGPWGLDWKETRDMKMLCAKCNADFQNKFQIHSIAPAKYILRPRKRLRLITWYCREWKCFAEFYSVLSSLKIHPAISFGSSKQLRQSFDREVQEECFFSKTCDQWTERRRDLWKLLREILLKSKALWLNFTTIALRESFSTLRRSCTCSFSWNVTCFTHA